MSNRGSGMNSDYKGIVDDMKLRPERATRCKINLSTAKNSQFAPVIKGSNGLAGLDNPAGGVGEESNLRGDGMTMGYFTIGYQANSQLSNSGVYRVRVQYSGGLRVLTGLTVAPAWNADAGKGYYPSYMTELWTTMRNINSQNVDCWADNSSPNFNTGQGMGYMCNCEINTITLEAGADEVPEQCFMPSPTSGNSFEFTTNNPFGQIGWALRTPNYLARSNFINPPTTGNDDYSNGLSCNVRTADLVQLIYEIIPID